MFSIMPNLISKDSAISMGVEVIRSESRALQELASRIDDRFSSAVNMILSNSGTVFVGGVGKSGLIGAKISATLASTGTPSQFLHAYEAMHGDLGRIRSCDVAILISNSGRTEEILMLANALRNSSVPLIGITDSDCNPLANLCDVVLPLGKSVEACHNFLAPTVSTAKILALGDALAVTLSKCRGFSSKDFLAIHPGGNLGKLNEPIKNILRREREISVVVDQEDLTLGEMLTKSSKNGRRSGAVLIVDLQGKLVGLLTDGDVRRILTSGASDVLETRVKGIMTRNPIAIDENESIAHAIEILRNYQIDEIPIVDDSSRPVALLDVQDVLSLSGFVVSSKE
jgi:arabinose-5-phosphate isomerase